MLIKTAERIKELRERNGLTQSDLARRLYVTRSSVNAWEMAISIPSTEKIAQLCQILHTTSDYLIGLDDNETLPLKSYSPEEKALIYHMIQYFDATKKDTSC